MYTLTKMSEPSWENTYNDIWTLKRALEREICSNCLSPNPDLFIGVQENYKELNTVGQLSELLATSCGCEFVICENTYKIIEVYFSKVDGII